MDRATTAEQKLKEHEKQKEQQLECYICKCSMRWPLRVCDAGHYACAPCLSQQIRCANGVRTIYNKDQLPSCKLDWRIKFLCGLCKAPALPKYDGPITTQLIDPNPVTKCPSCSCLFGQSTIGLHILTCDLQLVQCPFCKVEVQGIFIDPHIRNCCKKLRCKQCTKTMNWNNLEKHLHQHKVATRLTQCLPMLISKISPERSMDQFQNLVDIFLALNKLACENKTETPLKYEDVMDISLQPLSNLHDRLSLNRNQDTRRRPPSQGSRRPYSYQDFRSRRSSSTQESRQPVDVIYETTSDDIASSSSDSSEFSDSVESTQAVP
jgi:hypothetical protein